MFPFFSNGSIISVVDVSFVSTSAPDNNEIASTLSNATVVGFEIESSSISVNDISSTAAPTTAAPTTAAPTNAPTVAPTAPHIKYVVCSVTGSSVIDVFDRVTSVSDRCVYTLMKSEGSSGFNLMASFRERRRIDELFLDRLIISLPGVMINLEQGGRVLVNEQILTLSSIAHQHNGVEFSVDQNIVTVELPSYNMTILFDGNTAHVAGQIEAMEGLCGSPSDSSKTTSLAAEKSSSSSLPGCEIQHTDTVDNSIDCSLATHHCDLLRQAPFSACHNHSDPEPFITACTDTLCNYRRVDGVDCQFMEAYAQSCSLKADITLEDWRSTTTCSEVPVCQQLCSEHEFCGEKSGRGLCLCRGVFASKYTPTNSLGEPALCREDSASVTLAGCLLADKGIDYSVLHLNDPNCKGQVDNETHMVTFGFDSSNICGTEVVKNNSMILYKNAITTRNMSASSVITRHDQIQIDFSCLYKEPEIKSFSFRIKDSSVVQVLASGEWNYTLQMSAYLDQQLLYVVEPETELLLNQRVWLELKTEGLDENRVSIVTDSCWATSQASPNDSLRYDLINNGCPNANDKTVRLSGNGQGTSNVFSFNMFEFNGGNREIFLHCRLELCVRMGSSCQPTCTPRSRKRRRASKYVDNNPAIISMSWTK